MMVMLLAVVLMRCSELLSVIDIGAAASAGSTSPDDLKQGCRKRPRRRTALLRRRRQIPRSASYHPKEGSVRRTILVYPSGVELVSASHRCCCRFQHSQDHDCYPPRRRLTLERLKPRREYASFQKHSLFGGCSTSCCWLHLDDLDALGVR